MAGTNAIANAVRMSMLSSEAPAAAIAATQPYSTVDGSALTVQFHFDPDRFPFQQLPLRHPGIAAMYQRMVLDRYVRFMLDPGLSSGRQSYAESGRSVETLQKIADLNTDYTTHYHPTRELHPAWGSVELVRPGSGNLAAASRLGFAGLNVSLWDASHGLVSSSLLASAPAAEVQAVHDAFAARMRSMAKGDELPPLPEATGADWDALRARACEGRGGQHRGDGEVQLESEEADGFDLPTATSEPVLLGALREVGGAGFAQHVGFPMSAYPEHGRRSADSGAMAEPVAPWLLDSALARVATRVLAASTPERLLTPAACDPRQGGETWTKDAVNAAAVLPVIPVARNLECFSIDPTRPLNVAMAAPRVWDSFQKDPFSARLGEPYVAGMPVMAIKLKFLQDGVRCGGGAIAFTPLTRAHLEGEPSL
jgi:hypothetical protein